MGTRGFIGFVADGQEKITYNHWDSYPEALGVDMLDWLHDAVTDMDTLRAAVRNLRVITEGQKPAPGDVRRLAPYTNLGVGSRSTDDWYCLLRETQGNPELILEAGIVEDAGDFPTDSLFAEWGYVVDLDAGTFEVYRGFQTSPHSAGRFASRETPPRTIAVAPAVEHLLSGGAGGLMAAGCAARRRAVARSGSARRRLNRRWGPLWM